MKAIRIAFDLAVLAVVLWCAWTLFVRSMTAVGGWG